MATRQRVKYTPPVTDEAPALSVQDKLANATMNFTKTSLATILHSRNIFPDRFFDRDKKGRVSGIKQDMPPLSSASRALNHSSILDSIKNRSVRSVFDADFDRGETPLTLTHHSQLKRATLCIQTDDSDVKESLLEAYTCSYSSNLPGTTSRDSGLKTLLADKYTYKHDSVQVSIKNGKHKIDAGFDVDLGQVRAAYSERLEDIRQAMDRVPQNPMLDTIPKVKDVPKVFAVLRLDVSKKDCVLDDGAFSDDSQGDACEALRTSNTVEIGCFDNPAIGTDVSMFSGIIDNPVASSGIRPSIVAYPINISSIDTSDMISLSEDVPIKSKGQMKANTKQKKRAAEEMEAVSETEEEPDEQIGQVDFHEDANKAQKHQAPEKVMSYKKPVSRVAPPSKKTASDGQILKKFRESVSKQNDLRKKAKPSKKRQKISEDTPAESLSEA